MAVERSWGGVGTVAAWQVIASSSYYGTFAATAAIRAEFALSGFEIGMVLSAMTLGYTLFLFPAGAAVDAYGDRPTMVLGLFGLAAGVAGVSLAGTYPTLLGSVFVLGLAYATAMPSTNRAIAARAPRGRYNLAINVKQVGVTTGSAVAALLVTNISTVGFTWRVAFRVIGVAAAAAAAIFLLRYVNAGGTGEPAVPDIGGLGGNRAYRFLAVAGVFIGSAIFSTTGYLVPYLEDVGFDVEVAGVVLATMLVAGSVGRVAAGALADRLPTSSSGAALRVMGAQLAAAGVFLLAFPLLPLQARVPVVIGIGLGLMGVTGLYHGTLIALVPQDEAGAATAGGQTTINLGGLLAPPAFGLVIDSTGYTAGWWILGIATLLAVGLLYTSNRTVDR